MVAVSAVAIVPLARASHAAPLAPRTPQRDVALTQHTPREGSPALREPTARGHVCGSRTLCMPPPSHRPSEHMPPPYDRCAATVELEPQQMRERESGVADFSPRATRDGRREQSGACCYVVWQRCVVSSR